MTMHIDGLGERKLHVGTTARGERVSLTISLSQPAAPGIAVTTDHRVVAGGQVRLSMQSETIEKGIMTGGGQDLQAIRDVLAEGGEPAISALLLVELLGIWERWHLNDMRAACAHQQAEADRLYRDLPGYGHERARWIELRALSCPEGYKYGSAWLIELLPAKVADRVADIISGKINVETGEVEATAKEVPA